MLYLGRASVPTPKLGELLVQVHGASVKGGELVARAGGLRLLMLRSPFPRGTGIDFAGEIEAVEGDADGLVIGDRVWGLLPRDQDATGRGGVRHSAVRPRILQLGRALGAQVTGLASGRNLNLVTELGADNVIDRTTVRPGDLDTCSTPPGHS